MATLKLTTAAGKASKTSVDLDDAYFDVQPNVAVMHQVVTAQLAARRAGTQSTKTRAEVRGGGVTHAPKPRSYKQRTPKKMIRLALASALSDRRADGKVIVLDRWGIDTPSTKGAVDVLSKLGVEGRVLVVLGREEADVAVWKSLRNLQHVHVLTSGELNAYDVLVSDWVIFTKESLPTVHRTDAVANGDAASRGVESAERGGAEGDASSEAKK